MRTKILIVIPISSSYLSGLLRATKYLGIQTLVFNSRGRTLFEKIIIGVFRNRNFSTKLLNRRLVQTARDFKPDILLAMKAELINEDALKQINNLRIKTINWFPDYINAFELAKKLANMYDIFFHFDPYAMRLLKKLNLRAKIACLPFSADIIPGDLSPFFTNYSYNVSFIGNYYPIREKYLKKIADLGLNIWGDERWSTSSVAHCYQGGQLPNSKFAEVSRASKININIQHEFPCEGLVLRTFEVLGAGAFLLTESKKDAERLFKKSIVTFESPEDLRRKVVYFLAHDKEREKFANKGYLAVHDHHTYIHRLHQILKVLK